MRLPVRGAGVHPSWFAAPVASIDSLRECDHLHFVDYATLQNYDGIFLIPGRKSGAHRSGKAATSISVEERTSSMKPPPTTAFNRFNFARTVSLDIRQSAVRTEFGQLAAASNSGPTSDDWSNSVRVRMPTVRVPAGIPVGANASYATGHTATGWKTFMATGIAYVFVRSDCVGGGGHLAANAASSRRRNSVLVVGHAGAS